MKAFALFSAAGVLVLALAVTLVYAQQPSPKAPKDACPCSPCVCPKGKCLCMPDCPVGVPMQRAVIDIQVSAPAPLVVVAPTPIYRTTPHRHAPVLPWAPWNWLRPWWATPRVKS